MQIDEILQGLTTEQLEGLKTYLEEYGNGPSLADAIDDELLEREYEDSYIGIDANFKWF